MTEKLDAKEHREFRSCVGICQYITASKTKLKRIARHLKGRQRCVLNFTWVAKLEDVIHVTVDADWAGDPKARCSSSGGVLAVGPCSTVRHWSVTQATLSLSSAESAKAITMRCIEALYAKHLLWNTRRHGRSKSKFGRTAAAPRPSCNVLDQGAEQSTRRCRRCGFNS